MAEYTDNFHLIKPGQDDFYEVDEFNSNADILDAELKKAQDMGNAVYVHTKSGTIHALIGSGNNIKFKATADYAAGDTFAVNGIAVTAKTIDSAVLSTGDFKSGNWVEAALDGTALTFQFRSYAAELSNVLTYTPTADPPLPPLPIDADLLGGYKPEYYASAAGLGAVEGEVAGKADKNSPEFSGTPVSNGGYYQAGSTWGVSARYSYRGTISYGTANEYGPEFDIATATPPQEYDLPLAAGITVVRSASYWKSNVGEVGFNFSLNASVNIQNGAIIATFPIGFWPKVYKTYSCRVVLNEGNRIIAAIDVDLNGNVIYWGQMLEAGNQFVAFGSFPVA